ncbi:hypothetical protein TVAG_226840 [Trichomonas vaginalis G3]|uniref:Uncharacterized protein n=1 Tax=Trichomonas vaginalis (strain ATCC PRA-98 / G3) TaxID=412133 RepID=A2FCC8_TRIV3|nr:EF-hand calcium-binding domain-containing protein 5 family [Trichomonas vaginalis G3]EAX97440.1 hypothetical protein TVAG_226840 [Trichomonas vaginalis G3]KAI5551998.1 EF-hand calcium-binding domain-containing protein 5 family [Trichomonas vaginalis G3]|eukprot:XP_001310370.1 hypothetical protein [Trichomonas vaginalis G3]
MEELQAVIREKPELKQYLEEKLFPTLTDGFEALLVEQELMSKRVNSGEKLPEIQPILFLAQYLMRHNPNA